MKWMIGVMLLAVAGTVPAADDIYRCVSKAGKVTISNVPCAVSDRVASVRSVANDEELEPNRFAHAQADAASRMQDNRRLAASAATDRTYYSPSHQTPRVSAKCEQAKQRRAANGDRGSYDHRRSLDDAVWAACKGF